jgi:hypothetical protein
MSLQFLPEPSCEKQVKHFKIRNEGPPGISKGGWTIAFETEMPNPSRTISKNEPHRNPRKPWSDQTEN